MENGCVRSNFTKSILINQLTYFYRHDDDIEVQVKRRRRISIIILIAGVVIFLEKTMDI